MSIHNSNYASNNAGFEIVSEHVMMVKYFGGVVKSYTHSRRASYENMAIVMKIRNSYERAEFLQKFSWKLEQRKKLYNTFTLGALGASVRTKNSNAINLHDPTPPSAPPCGQSVQPRNRGFDANSIIFYEQKRTTFVVGLLILVGYYFNNSKYCFSREYFSIAKVL